jgi:hypothetical protein
MPSSVFVRENGVLMVLWAHSCGHLSMKVPYATRAQAESVRAAWESRPCWECRVSAEAARLRGPNPCGGA